MTIANARVFLDEALDALTNDAVEIIGSVERQLEPLEATIADDLERMNRAIGGDGRTLLAAIAAEVRRAAVAIAAARAALG